MGEVWAMSVLVRHLIWYWYRHLHCVVEHILMPSDLRIPCFRAKSSAVIAQPNAITVFSLHSSSNGVESSESGNAFLRSKCDSRLLILENVQGALVFDMHTGHASKGRVVSSSPSNVRSPLRRNIKVFCSNNLSNDCFSSSFKRRLERASLFCARLRRPPSSSLLPSHPSHSAAMQAMSWSSSYRVPRRRFLAFSTSVIAKSSESDCS